MVARCLYYSIIIVFLRSLVSKYCRSVFSVDSYYRPNTGLSTAVKFDQMIIGLMVAFQQNAMLLIESTIRVSGSISESVLKAHPIPW